VEAAADEEKLVMAMPAPPPPAVSAPESPAALAVGRRPLIAAGIGVGLALVVGAIFLVVRPQAASASHPAGPAATTAALDPQTASAAAALAGEWAFDRADCATPMTLSVSGDQLSLTSSGTTEVATIEPGVVGGAVRTHGPGGEASYALRQGSLTMSEAGAPPTQLTRCAG
jgi:hypothetical protein